MTRSSRRAALPALIIAAAIALPLAGCAAEPAPAPAPAPTSAEPAAEIGSVLVHADSLGYLDGDGVRVDGVRDAYAEPIDAALARLTALLGDPVDQTYESPYTSGTGTLHRWNGFALDEFPAEMVADGPDAPTWGVRLESASAGGVELATVGGLAVGDPVPAGLETSPCGALMAEVVGTLGVQIDVDGTEVAVAGIRSPIYTDACE